MVDRNNAASELRAAAAKHYEFPLISMSTTSTLSGELTCFFMTCLVSFTSHCFGRYGSGGAGQLGDGQSCSPAHVPLEQETFSSNNESRLP